MPQRSREVLKTYFAKGTRPTADHYIDLIDSFGLTAPDGTTNGDGTIEIKPFGRTLFVDNFTEPSTADLDGVRGVITRPYSTLQEAILDANAGDLIVILPSQTPYSATQLFVPGLSYYAFPGVIIENTASGTPIFFGQASGVCKLTGYATLRTSVGGMIARVDGSGAQLHIECSTIEGGALEKIIEIAAPSNFGDNAPKVLVERAKITSSAVVPPPEPPVDGEEPPVAPPSMPLIQNQNGIIRLKNIEIISSTQATAIESIGGFGVYEILGSVTSNMRPSVDANVTVGHLSFNEQISVW